MPIPEARFYNQAIGGRHFYCVETDLDVNPNILIQDQMNGK